ncbi:unnamed protein product [Protopolystoma xenopodis]|uniref:Uncharacterized protein n=1 Tax=Protopolystoma xenopodis TaxID=117903 RepID=A0A3S5AA91_9PLAT|nr:unnamed protein product [Protopolystoma xenopodis]
MLPHGSPELVAVLPGKSSCTRRILRIFPGTCKLFQPSYSSGPSTVSDLSELRQIKMLMFPTLWNAFCEDSSSWGANGPEISHNEFIFSLEKLGILVLYTNANSDASALKSSLHSLNDSTQITGLESRNLNTPELLWNLMKGVTDKSTIKLCFQSAIQYCLENPVVIHVRAFIYIIQLNSLDHSQFSRRLKDLATAKMELGKTNRFILADTFNMSSKSAFILHGIEPLLELAIPGLLLECSTFDAKSRYSLAYDSKNQFSFIKSNFDEHLDTVLCLTPFDLGAQLSRLHRLYLAACTLKIFSLYCSSSHVEPIIRSLPDLYVLKMDTDRPSKISKRLVYELVPHREGELA